MERLHVSVSRRSLFPLLMALCGLGLCFGMVQRMQDPLYPMTMEYYLYLATGALLAVIGLFTMRRFPWMCIIPVVCYVYGGLLMPTAVEYYQIAMLVPLLLLLVGRYRKWTVWMLKGLEIITILVPFAMSFVALQDDLLALEMEGYLTDAVKQTRWVHFLTNEVMFFVGMIFMTLSLRWNAEEIETEDDETEEGETASAQKELVEDDLFADELDEAYQSEEEAELEQDLYTRPQPQPSPESNIPPTVAPTPPQQHRGGGYPYNRPIQMPVSQDTEPETEE
jgi:hypothetical protein